MASPMSWIRKYQKAMLVVFGVMLMVAFLMPQFFDFSGRPAPVSQENPTVVRWNGGQLTRFELNRLRVRHVAVLDFLNQIVEVASQKKGEQVRPAAMPIQAIAAGDNQGDQEDADDQLTTRYIFAREAASYGLEISDAMVNDYLSLMSGDVDLTEDELRLACQRATNGMVSIKEIRDQLKLELAYREYSQMSNAGLPFVPNPSYAAQLYARTSEEIECVVLPLKIADNLARVTTKPEESELRKLFEAGRYELPDPAGKDPGFKLPKRVVVEYLHAVFEDFLQNEVAKLTDEQVQAEYDRLVAAEDPLVMELVDPVPPLSPETPADGTPAGGGAAATEGAAPAASGDPASGDAGKMPAAEPPVTDPPTAETPSSEPAKDPAVTEPKTEPGTAEPAGEPSLEPAGGGEPAGTEPGGSGGNGQPEMTRTIMDQVGRTVRDLAAMVGEGMDRNLVVAQPQEPGTPEPAAGEPTTQEPAAQEPTTQEPGGTTETPKTETPAAETPKSEQPSTETQPAAGSQEPAAGMTPPADAPIAPASGTQDPAANAAGDAGTPAPVVPVQEKRAKPLKDVVDQVKRQMRMREATEAMQVAVEAAAQELRDYQSDLNVWKSMEGDPEQGPEPTALVIADVARKHGLKSGKTELVDSVALAETEVGKLQVRLSDPQFRGRFVQASNAIFAEFNSTREFEPTMQQQTDGDVWIYWLAEKREVEVLEYNEARDQVEAFWKLQQARKITEAEAQNHVDEINKGGLLLSQKFGERAIKTGVFTWFTSNMFGFDYGTPVGVSLPGDEFMEKAFSLERDKAGWAPNRTGEELYVIQKIATDRRSTVELTDNFLGLVATNQRIPEAIIGASQAGIRRVNQKFIDQFLAEKKIEWLTR